MGSFSFIRVGLFAILSVVLSGCAAVAPFTSALTGTAPTAGLEVHTQTSVKLQEGNFVTVRTNVVGRSKGFKLLGFITIVPATMDQAMNQLYADAQMQHGRPQTLANLMIEHSGVYVILFSIPRITARADLIEFLPLEVEENQPESQGIRRATHRQNQRFRAF